MHNTEAKAQLHRAADVLRSSYEPQYIIQVITALLAVQAVAQEAQVELSGEFNELAEFLSQASRQLPELDEALSDFLQHSPEPIIAGFNKSNGLQMVRHHLLDIELPKDELGWLLHDWQMEALGKRGGFFVQRTLAQTAIEWTSQSAQGQPAYCPFSASFSFAYAYAVNGSLATYAAPVLSEVIWAKLMSVFCDNRIIVQHADPVTDKSDQFKEPDKYNHGTSFPHWSAKLSYLPQGANLDIRHQPASSETILAQAFLERISGRAVILVPPGFLFRTTTGDKSFKEELVRSGKLVGVIQYAENTLAATSVAMVMLLIDSKGGLKEPLMIDATGAEFYQKERFTNRFIGKEQLLEIIAGTDSPVSKCITVDEAEANEWNLDVRRYVLSESIMRLHKQLNNLPTQPLSEIVQFVRCQAVKGGEEGACFLEANQADIDEIGNFSRPTKQVLISDIKNMSVANKQQIFPGDVLVTVKGKVGKIGLVTTADDNWLAGQSFIVLRLKSNSPIKDSTYLYRYLSSPIAQQELLRTASGSTVKILKMNDLKDLPVVIPTQSQIEEASDKQQQMVSLQQQITQIQQQIEALRHDDWLKL